MPVVINEFEVMPDSPTTGRDAGREKADEKGSGKPEMSDYKIKRMMERRAERLERVSAH